MKKSWFGFGKSASRSTSGLSDYEQQVVEGIEKFGWFGTHVFDPIGETPPFTYSIGFSKTLRAPEFIVFGLDKSLMHQMLWEIYRQIEAGTTPSDHQRWSDILGGHDCISRTVHPTNVVRDYFNTAIWLWGDPAERGGPLNAMQMVWPGAQDGLFPWDDGASDSVRELQPPLYLPNPKLH